MRSVPGGWDVTTSGKNRRQGVGSCSSKIKTHWALSTDIPSNTDPSPFLSKAVPISPLQQQGNPSVCSLTPTQLQSISRSVSPRREFERIQQEGCSNLEGLHLLTVAPHIPFIGYFGHSHFLHKHMPDI